MCVDKLKKDEYDYTTILYVFNPENPKITENPDSDKIAFAYSEDTEYSI